VGRREDGTTDTKYSNKTLTKACLPGSPDNNEKDCRIQLGIETRDKKEKVGCGRDC
jgi:hypothetical protein